MVFVVANNYCSHFLILMFVISKATTTVYFLIYINQL